VNPRTHSPPMGGRGNGRKTPLMAGRNGGGVALKLVHRPSPRRPAAFNLHDRQADVARVELAAENRGGTLIHVGTARVGLQTARPGGPGCIHGLPPSGRAPLAWPETGG